VDVGLPHQQEAVSPVERADRIPLEMLEPNRHPSRVGECEDVLEDPGAEAVSVQLRHEVELVEGT